MSRSIWTRRPSRAGDLASVRGGAAALLLGFVVVAAALAQDSQPESRAFPDAAALAHRFSELRPVIEHVLGTTLPADLGVDLGETVDVHAEMVEEETILSTQMESRAFDLGARPRLTASGRFSSTGGWPALSGRTLLVLSQNWSRFVAAETRPPMSQQAWIDMALAEAAIGWHQRARMGFVGACARTSGDDMRTARIAGFASHEAWVLRHVAGAIGQPGACAAYSNWRLRALEDAWSYALEAPGRFTRTWALLPASMGDSFFEAIQVRLGYAGAVARLVSAPPSTLTHLTRTEAYLAGESVPASCDALARLIRSALPPGVTPELSCVPALDLSRFLSAADAQAFENVMRGFVVGAAANGTPTSVGDSSRLGSGAVLTFTTPAIAEAAAALAVARVVATTPERTELSAVSAPESRAIADRNAVVFSGKARNADGVKGGPWRAVVMTRGASVIILELSGKNDPLPRLEQAVSRVLSGLEAGPESAPVAESRTADSATLVMGRLTYRGGSGSPEAFRIRFWLVGSEQKTVDVTGHDGTFEVALPLDVPVTLGRIEVEGVVTDSKIGRRVTPTKEDGIELIVDAPTVRQVEVVDAEMGLPIAGARITRASGWQRSRDRDGIIVPDPESAQNTIGRTGRDGRANIDVGRTTSAFPTACWVVADGYAWGEAEFGATATRSVRVALERGAKCRVRLQGWGRLEGARLFVQPARTEGGKWAFESPREVTKFIDRDVCAFEGLPPGPIGILAKRGEAFENGFVLGSALLVLEAGEVRQVDLHLHEEAKRADVGGQVTVHPAWKLKSPTDLQMRGRAGSTLGLTRSTTCTVDRATGIGSFTFDDVPAGEWEVEVVEAHYVIIATTPTSELLVITVPEPGTIVAKVFDAETGTPVSKARVTWELDRRVDPSEFSSGVWRDRSVELTADVDKLAWRGLAPPSSVKVRVTADGYGDEDESVTVVSGQAAPVTFRVERVGAIRVECVGAPEGELGWGAVFLTRTEASGAKTTRALYSPPESHVYQESRIPLGRWQLCVKKIPGFTAVEPREIEIKADDECSVIIEMTKER